MPLSASTIMRAVCFGVRAEENIFSTTSCTGRPSLLRFSLVLRARWAFSQAFYAGDTHESQRPSRYFAASTRCSDGRASRAHVATWLLSRLQHHGAKGLLGQGHTRPSHYAC